MNQPVPQPAVPRLEGPKVVLGPSKGHRHGVVVVTVACSPGVVTWVVRWGQT